MARLDWHPPKIESVTATYSWSVLYAARVYFGGSTDEGSIPGRNWTDPAIARLDLPQLFADKFKANPNIRSAFISTAEELGDEFKSVIDDYEFNIPSSSRKRFKDLPTMNTISDSEDLKNSQSMEVD
jgi:hypothetical protein